MSKDNYRLGRLGVLAPAALSACMDASVLAVPAAGAIVSTVLKELSKAFMLKKWFHGNMSAKEAESLMMERGRNGSFLVRESRGHPGDYVLSVRVRGRVSHVIIRKQHNKYDVGSGERFDDLVGLIEHFRLYPMFESSGDVLRLLQPISASSLRAKYITRKVQDTKAMEDLKEVKCEYDSEFNSLQEIDNLQDFTTIEAIKPENMCKNRYKNILAYDQTRVILQRHDESTGSDYINANYISSYKLSDSLSSVQSSNESLHSVHSLKDGKQVKKLPLLTSKSLSDEALKELKRCIRMDKVNGNLDSTLNITKRKYIATQGCLNSTIGDFWRMIWQEDVRIIVMITREIESGKKKCERYWPTCDVPETFDCLNVRLITETLCDDYLIRELELTNNCKSRTIYQYQYTTWPDHGTPTKPSSVLAFVIDINKKMNCIMQNENKPEQNIICVHCSAGVGRTGTFIVLDMLIHNILKDGFNACDVDVCHTAKLVRSQRYGMVQNKSQYRFIYMAIQEYIASYISKD